MNEFEEIEGLLNDFVAKQEAEIVQQQVKFQEQIKNALSAGGIQFFALYDESKPIGFVGIGLQSSRINLLHVDESVDDIRKKERFLFDYAFDQLLKTSSIVRIGGRELGTTLEGYFESKGFQRFDRKHMTLSREKIEGLRTPVLPTNYTFTDYTKDCRDKIAEVIFDANKGSIDVQVFPEFFGSLDTVHQLLENIENDRYGKYKEPHSKILTFDNKFIGVCLLTMTSDDTGYIPDIALLQKYRGKGLGKSLLVYSLKEMMKIEEGLMKNNLDVTLANPAKHLYESLGYEDVRHYSLYAWTKSE